MDERRRPDCEAVRERFSDYLRGELPRQECAGMRQHMRACPECARELRTMVGILAPLGRRRSQGESPNGRPRRLPWPLSYSGNEPRRMRWRLLFLAAIGVAALTFGNWYPGTPSKNEGAAETHELPDRGEWLACEPRGWRLFLSAQGHRIALEPGARVRVVQSAPLILWWEAGELRIEGCEAELCLEVGFGRIRCDVASFAGRVLDPGVEMRVEKGSLRLENARGETAASAGEIARLAPGIAPMVAPLEAGDAARGDGADS